MVGVGHAKQLQLGDLDPTRRKFRGLAGPKNIPDDVAKAWLEAMKIVLASPAYKEQIAKESLIVSLMGRDEARKFTDAFVTDVSASLKELGVVK